MKVECTELEKKWLLNLMKEAETCPKTIDCPEEEHTCESCLENQIKWIVTKDKS